MSRAKTGGRVSGTPNRRTTTVQEKLRALGCDPIEGMAKIAMDNTAELTLRAQMLKELAQYVAPKLKSVEVSSDEKNPLTLENLVKASYCFESLQIAPPSITPYEAKALSTIKVRQGISVARRAKSDSREKPARHCVEVAKQVL